MIISHLLCQQKFSSLDFWFKKSAPVKNLCNNKAISVSQKPSSKGLEKIVAPHLVGARGWTDRDLAPASLALHTIGFGAIRNWLQELGGKASGRQADIELTERRAYKFLDT